MPSQFFWHELMTTDVKAAEKFYSDVVGWKATDSGAPGQQYTLFNVGDRGVGGMLAITPDMAKHGARPGWLGYIAVDDVDQAVARLKQEGGKVDIEPQEVPGIIRFAMVADPQGATFYIAKGLRRQSAAAPGHRHARHRGLERIDGVRLAGRLCLLFQDVRLDQGGSARHGPDGHLSAFCRGRAGHRRHDDQARRASGRLLGLLFQRAGDRRGHREESRPAAARSSTVPCEVPGGQWVVQAMDPQGAAFNLVAPTDAKPHGPWPSAPPLHGWRTRRLSSPSRGGSVRPGSRCANDSR